VLARAPLQVTAARGAARGVLGISASSWPSTWSSSC